MKKVNEVLFGEHGLTSTSANHLANIAQEKIVIPMELQPICDELCELEK
jgi:hypothetical protein